jgi:hypothetical protein
MDAEHVHISFIISVGKRQEVFDGHLFEMVFPVALTVGRFRGEKGEPAEVSRGSKRILPLTCLYFFIMRPFQSIGGAAIALHKQRNRSAVGAYRIAED